jgi:3-deoxy-D-manno-octulosonic-acid transferase
VVEKFRHESAKLVNVGANPTLSFLNLKWKIVHMSSASTEWLKKAAFTDELINRLLLIPLSEVDEETKIVIDYLQARVKEIKDKHG